MAKTLANLRTEALYRLGDPNSGIWSTAEIDAYIKEGYDDLCYRAKALWRRSLDSASVQSAIDDVAGTATYTLPAEIHEIERATWDNQAIPAYLTEEIAQSDPAFRTQQGDVEGYMLDGDGLRVLRKLRVPSATVANKFVLEYFRRGATLSSGATELELPNQYARYVRHFAIWKALEREGEGQDLDLADHYRLRYEAGVARLQRRRLDVRKKRAGRFGDGGPRGGPPPRPRLPWNYGRVVR